MNIVNRTTVLIKGEFITGIFLSSIFILYDNWYSKTACVYSTSQKQIDNYFLTILVRSESFIYQERICCSEICQRKQSLFLSGFTFIYRRTGQTEGVLTLFFFIFEYFIQG